MTRSTQPQPIANIEAEQALLGALLLNNEVLDRIGFLQPEQGLFRLDVGNDWWRDVAGHQFRFSLKPHQ